MCLHGNQLENFVLHRFDIHALNESAKQDEEGIKKAALKGKNAGFKVCSRQLLAEQSLECRTL